MCISPERYDDLRLVVGWLTGKSVRMLLMKLFFAEELFTVLPAVLHVFPHGAEGRGERFMMRVWLLLGMETGRWDSSLLMALSMSPSLDSTHNDKLSFTLGFKGAVCRFLWTRFWCFMRAF